MRVLFRTMPLVGVTQKLAGGRVVSGNFEFEAVVFDPGETVPAGYHPDMLTAWRRDPFTRPDGSMRVPVPPTVTVPAGVTIPAVVIPADLLVGLPGDAKLCLTWNMRAGGVR